ncbi:hypothetical protein ACFPME_13260 [Rhodanobacter umsongensis]|uniref:DUF4440 domain-containing protein n=1 Tax=Rhodanobacter umsongensis TaxID=633153 RepID=A0ABW0JN80_9GAMM
MTLSNRITCLLVAVALCALALPGCRRTPDEAQVRAAIAAVAQAAEASSASDLAARLSEDFDGNAGQLDRNQLAGVVRLLALRGEHIGVVMGPVSVEHRGERMVASFTVTLTSGGQLLPDQLGIYQVESAWRKDDGTWRCYTASWKHTI